MSCIENFFVSFPADTSIRSTVEEQLNTFENRTLVPIEYFETAFATAGSYGIQSVEASLMDMGVEVSPSTWDLVFPKVQPELAAILWGALLPELRFAKDCGRFETAAYITKLNRLLTKTAAPLFAQPDLPAEFMNADKQNEVSATFQIDPTGTLFYTDPFHLPNGIRKFLTNNNFFSSSEIEKTIEQFGQRSDLLRGIPVEEMDSDFANFLDSVVKS